MAAAAVCAALLALYCTARFGWHSTVTGAALFAGWSVVIAGGVALAVLALVVR